MTQFVRDVLQTAGVVETKLLGSSGKKKESGDIDLAIGPIPTGKSPDDFKRDVLRVCQERLGSEHAKLLGQNIAVNLPIVSSDPERKDLRVQVDLMVSENPENTAWLMSGTGDAQVKGVFRNLLLSYLAKKKSLETGDKVTIAFPGGVQVSRDNTVVVDRTENPETILRVLGIDSKPSDLSNFEQVFDAAQAKIDITEFENYIAPYAKRLPDETAYAMSSIKKRQLSESKLRKVIRSILSL